ncbi:unnamed protein product [Phytophthora lilii]|uniref:Unnamed protein product n=1 Tax=Phytophthora lilii TaxID=2077276 RepID=A0A9W6XJH6_9STRA|nr:unnamed protein product [Phytophthora lilii]
MHRLNRRMVGHATWFALCSEDDMCTQKSVEAIQRVVRSRPEFVEIADLHRRDCTWERMKLVFLVRYAPKRWSKGKQRHVQLNIVAELPDCLFQLVAEFLKPRFDDMEEAQKERFKTVLDLPTW